MHYKWLFKIANCWFSLNPGCARLYPGVGISNYPLQDMAAMYLTYRRDSGSDRQVAGQWLDCLVYPVVMSTVCELENGHRNSGFTHQKWWFSIVMLVYQRVLQILVAQIGKKPGVFVQFSWDMKATFKTKVLLSLFKKWDAQPTVFRPTQMTQNLAYFLNNPDTKCFKFFIDITQ